MVVRKILETTILSGGTTATFTDSDIPNSLIRVYSTNSNLYPQNISLAGNVLTVTYEEVSSNTGVALEIVKQGLDINDTLTSEATDEALSAKQGKVLKDALDDLSSVVSSLDIPDNITDLDDVNVTSIQDGQILAWDDLSSKFVNVDQSGGTGGINYSLDEQDTGIKWIDGNTIYQKTIDFGALPNNTTKSVNHGISNIDKIVNIEACAGYTGMTYGEMMPIVYSNKTFRVDVRSNVVEVISGDDWSSYSAYITIKYTKS